MEKVCSDPGDRKVLSVLITQIRDPPPQGQKQNPYRNKRKSPPGKQIEEKEGKKKKCFKGQRISIANELNTKLRKEQNLNSDDFEKGKSIV